MKCRPCLQRQRYETLEWISIVCNIPKACPAAERTARDSFGASKPTEDLVVPVGRGALGDQLASTVSSPPTGAAAQGDEPPEAM